MKKYRRKPVIIEAEQWFKLGDVPEANIEYITKLEDFIDYINFDTVDIIKFTCEVCGRSIYKHGIIDTLEGKHIVCPGDYVVKDIKGEFYPCKPDIFKETYEEVSNKSGRDEALELFSEARGFTKEEAESYNESLSKLFVKVDDNIFDEPNKTK